MSKDSTLSVIAYLMRVDKEKLTPGDLLGNGLGMDSMDRVELELALEDEFEIAITDDDAEKWETVQDIVNFVESKV